VITISNDYFTIAQEARCKVQVGACRFFGSVAQVTSEEDTKEFLAKVREEHPSIKEHCWAYRLGIAPNQVARYSDAGEPSQTAGPPILRAIDHLELTNTMVVVTRYFGEKQGVGGLIRAFHLTAATVLKEAGVRQELVYIPIILECRYEQLSYILHELTKAEAKELRQEYGEKVLLTATLRPMALPDLANSIGEWTKGSVQVREAKELD